MVMILHDLKPFQNTRLELFVRLVLGFMLHVKDRRKVPILQFHMFDEILRLCLGRRVDTIEMVGTTGEAILTSLIEVVLKILVNDTGTLSRLDIHEANGILVDLSVVLQFLPVNLPLMVTDIDTMNLIALRVTGIPIERTPTEAERSDKDIIEEKDIKSDDQRPPSPPSPSRHVLKETHKEPWPLMADRTRDTSLCRRLMLRFTLCRHILY